MHRSWLRDKLAASRARMANKVTQHAKSLVPKPRTETDPCMVCGRAIRPGRTTRGDGRVCSPACARIWTEKL